MTSWPKEVTGVIFVPEFLLHIYIYIYYRALQSRSGHMEESSCDAGLAAAVLPNLWGDLEQKWPSKVVPVGYDGQALGTFTLTVIGHAYPEKSCY